MVDSWLLSKPSSLSLSSFSAQLVGSGSIKSSFLIVITKLLLSTSSSPGLSPASNLLQTWALPSQYHLESHHLHCLHFQDPYLAVYSAGVGAKCCHVSKLKHCNACLSSSVCAWARSPNPQVTHNDPGAMSLEPKWLRSCSGKYEPRRKYP